MSQLQKETFVHIRNKELNYMAHLLKDKALEIGLQM